MQQPLCYLLRIDSAYTYTEEGGDTMYTLLAGAASVAGGEGPPLTAGIQLALILPVATMNGMRLCSRLRKVENADAPKHVASLHQRVTMRPQQVNAWFFGLIEKCDVRILDYTFKIVEGASLPQPDGSKLPIFIVHCETATGPVAVVLSADAVDAVGDHLSDKQEFFLRAEGMFCQKISEAQAQAKKPKPGAAPHWWQRLLGSKTSR